ncbi:MAG: sialidase family protein, partial [Candidatus Zixiibacteriota bacterium]
MKRCILISVILTAAILAARQAGAEGQMWGNDVLVHQANHIYGFGMDQGDKDTLLLVVSDSSTTNLKDTLYLYRSTDNGQTWSHEAVMISGGDNVRMGKADIIAAKGDSNFVFVFWIYNHKLYYNRYNYNSLSGYSPRTVGNENVVDFSICQDLYSNYWLYVVYQTDQDSVIFKRCRDYGWTWEERKNLTAITPITNQPTMAFSRGTYLVVAGKTDDDTIYTIRNDNSGNLANWKDGQYPSGIGDCDAPVLAASHTAPCRPIIIPGLAEKILIITFPAN